MLLDGRRGQRLGFDICGNMQRADCGELKAVFFAPAAELRGGLHIRSLALSPAAAIIAGTGKSDEGTAGMISTPVSFTNYKFDGFTDRSHHTQLWLIGQSDYDP
jgi:hypothetical protein